MRSFMGPVETEIILGLNQVGVDALNAIWMWNRDGLILDGGVWYKGTDELKLGHGSRYVPCDPVSILNATWALLGKNSLWPISARVDLIPTARASALLPGGVAISSSGGSLHAIALELLDQASMIPEVSNA